jgi:hypothetical protein
MTENLSDLPAIFAGCCLKFDFDSLLKSPPQLVAFLSLCRVLKGFEPEVRTAAVNMALAGTEIPGYTLVRQEANGYVAADTLSELFATCPVTLVPALLAELVRILGNISAARYRPICEATGIMPDEAVIKQNGPTAILRQNPK